MLVVFIISSGGGVAGVAVGGAGSEA